jgi:hypothetical protein
MLRRLILLLGALCAVMLTPQTPRPAAAQFGGATVSLPAGWNLIAAPPGTTIGGLKGALYTLQPGDNTYEASELTDGTTFGDGYWAYFPQGTLITLASGRQTSYTVIAKAGQPLLIGNPSGLSPATVSGADAVLTYDPLNGYQSVDVLPPGRGAWVFSTAGGTITVTPLPATSAAARSLAVGEPGWPGP